MRTATALALFAAGAAVLCAAAPPVACNPPPAVVPAYGSKIEYATGQAGVSSAADAKRMIELLESIDQRLAGIEAKTVGPVAAKKGPDLFAVARAKCAACHTPAKSEAKGGGFILFADDAPGGLKPLSVREKARVKEAVQSGTMPPNAKLTPAERSAFE